MSENPYASPESNVQQSSYTDNSSYRLATIQQRVVSLILDLFFCYILLEVFKLILAVFEIDLALILYNAVVMYLIALLLYYLIQESVWHWTLAKRVMRTHVVDVSGNAPKLSQILIRSVCRFIPFEFMSFFSDQDKLQASSRRKLLQRKPVGWHDKVSNTRVIDVRTI